MAGRASISRRALEPPRLGMNAPLGPSMSDSLGWRGARSHVRLRRRARALWPRTGTRFRRMGISGFYSRMLPPLKKATLLVKSSKSAPTNFTVQSENQGTFAPCPFFLRSLGTFARPRRREEFASTPAGGSKFTLGALARQRRGRPRRRGRRRARSAAGSAFQRQLGAMDGSVTSLPRSRDMS